MLRWASISPDSLRRGLSSGFLGVDDCSSIGLRETTNKEWGVTQTTYSIYFDHSGITRNETPEAQATAAIAKRLGFQRRKLLEDLNSGDKLFVYRTYDHTLDADALAAISAAMKDFPRAVLLYVQHTPEGRRPFAAERRTANLIVGFIDRFAPVGGKLHYNPDGWEAVCRSAIKIWHPDSEEC
jgi:hypothetical protein